MEEESLSLSLVTLIVLKLKNDVVGKGVGAGRTFIVEEEEELRLILGLVN